jgi:hypothetical protein
MHLALLLFYMHLNILRKEITQEREHVHYGALQDTYTG